MLEKQIVSLEAKLQQVTKDKTELGLLYDQKS